MRTVTYGAACSLDGFIADRDGAVDWLHFSADVQAIMAKYWKTIDTLLFGRKTWEFAVSAGGGGPGGADSKMQTYVFSRTLKELGHPDVQLVSEDAGGFVRDLKAQQGKGICVMSGGNLARSLFEAGVIDEVGLNIHPILLGSGVQLFLDAGRTIKLELVENRTINGGCVYALYRVKG
jgi:dihydrofolate reductase